MQNAPRQPAPLRLDAGWASEGRAGRPNQDLATSSGELFLVADGVGGHAGGAEAASIAASTITGAALRYGHPAPSELLRAFLVAHRRIKLSQTGAQRQMATCVVALSIDVEDRLATVTHVGDCRAYLVRNGLIRQLTTDHRVYGSWLHPGRRPRQAVYQALGTGRDPTPDVASIHIEAGDTFVLCSDGVHDALDDTLIQHTVAETGPQEAGRALVEAAMARGALGLAPKDDATAFVIRAMPSSSERGGETLRSTLRPALRDTPDARAPLDSVDTEWTEASSGRRTRTPGGSGEGHG